MPPDRGAPRPDAGQAASPGRRPPDAGIPPAEGAPARGLHRPALLRSGVAAAAPEGKTLEYTGRQALKSGSRMALECGGAWAGAKIGASFLDEGALEYAKKCLEEAKGRIILPIDSVVTDSFEEKEGRLVKVVDGDIEEGLEGVDIGPKSAKKFAEVISKAKMVFWNGPMGVFEQEAFQAGTKAVCEAIRDLKGKAFTVCGGGDSAAAIKQFGYVEDFSHVSTGGGASLEMIQNDGHLPGVDILK